MTPERKRLLFIFLRIGGVTRIVWPERRALIVAAVLRRSRS